MTKEFLNKVNRFMDLTCLMLKIDKPALKFVDIVPSGSHASYHPKTDTIYVIDGFDERDIHTVCMFIAHELRHKWQIENEVYDFSAYEEDGKHDFYEYNMRPAELDANAFGAFAVEMIFDVDVVFENIFPDEICEALYARLDDFYEEDNLK